MRVRLPQTLIGILCAVVFCVTPLQAGEVAKANLDILGLALEVDREPVTTAVDVPAYVKTKYGGAPAEGLSAIGELTGPGIDVPITLVTKPGQPFALPALHEKGEYQLQRIRLVGANGEFLQDAVPSFAVITVTDVLKTNVSVRQLTAEELRERGIVIDSRNYEVYEYTFVFGVDQQSVAVPYPVIVDKRTHQVVPVPRESQYTMPKIPVNGKPPRFQLHEPVPFVLGGGPIGSDTATGPETAPRPKIPAALVIPNGFGVLHQFFAVILQVENSAPLESNIRLDSITATINAPLQLRVAKVMPAVSIGQPVPIKDEATGQTFLVAGARGNAEWALEALKTGTHSVNIEVNATYQKPGQDDVPLRGRVSASLVVSDPRFHINFSHPDTVRKDESYTAYAFVTNLSPQQQHVVLDLSHIPTCSSGAAVDNICRQAGDAKEEFDLKAGEMRPVPYKLTSKITGRVFAAAGSANDEAVGVSMQLTMGVSASGIPLSPATLIMPYYTQFLPSAFVDANMQFLGLAYSLATAPLNQYTAKFPRLIKTDVFYRAQQIARAGQRVFITRKQRDANDPLENRDAFFHLALDLLGNTERLDQINTAPDLQEWDELRRLEQSARRAGAALARELETNGFDVNAFAAATSHRTPFLFAYAHGADVNGIARPYALSVKTLGSGQLLDVPAEAESGWIRTLPYGELTKLNAGGDVGELAIVGRWREEDFRISVIPARTAFTLHLIYPDQANGTQLRTDIDITNATPGVAVEIDIRRGARTLIVKNGSAIPLVDSVPQTALDVIAAAQDLHLDPDGHIVTLLLNRPVSVPDVKTLRDRFALTVNVAKANYTITRKNTATQLQIPGASLQDDARILAVTFDKTLSRNAQYELDYENVENDIVPRIDNDRPGAILTGKVLRGDNTPIADVLVRLDMPRKAQQIDISGADGRFLYEFVARDIDSNQFGDYTLSADAEGKKTSAEGAVRLPGEVHNVNLMFLGRGRAVGQVRYSDGQVIPSAVVTVGSTLFNQFRRGTTNAEGNFDIGDLPVGPLTFSVIDKDGRPTFAANHIRTAGEVITQDLVIERREAPGTGTVRVTVKRSDTNQLVAGADVGVWMQGYGLQTGRTDTDGSFTFTGVPAGLISILAVNWEISRHSVGVEVELRKDQTLEQTIVLSVPTAQTQYATLDGTITRDDPTAPGDATKDQIVAGAIITIAGLPAVTAGADGKYVYPDVPLEARDRWITVFDPSTGRRGNFVVPALVAGSNHMSMKLRSADPTGYATLRVRVTDARGQSVSGYRVMTPGYPPEKFLAKGSGTYELPNIQVPQTREVVAVPNGVDAEYGEQAVRGAIRVDFPGQLGIADLRLPGAGTIVVRTELETTCSTPPCYSPAIGPASITYRVWDEAEQNFMAKTITAEADPVTGLVTFQKVPAKQDVIVATYRNPIGYASSKVTLAFDGDVRTVPLRVKTIGDVSGRVLSFDRITPVANATVRIFTKTATYAPAITAPDGTFRFPGIPANTAFTIVADLSEDGIYRTGRVDGKSPTGGGPVSDLLVVMREQSTVEGQVIDDAGAAVPLARYWLRELSWPYRTYGTPQDPLQADIGGHFIVANVFTGPFRITAVSPEVQEVRGDYQGTIIEEGDADHRAVQLRIGGAGIGAVSITVVDPQLAFTPVANAEVALIRNNRRFDFATTNDNGVVFFDEVPAGSDYAVHAFSKSAGRAGNSAEFSIVANETASTTVHLEFRGIVSGTLIDPESEPVANAPSKGTPVTISSSGSRTADSTDSTGAFEFLGVPEGSFMLAAQEIGSGRKATGPSGLFISKLVPERRNITMELERTGTLTLNVYLPNDTGGAGQLAPLAEATVTQGYNALKGTYTYYRGLQGNPLTFKKLLRGRSYSFEVRELGGESRIVKGSGTFATGELAKTHTVILPTSGTVEVKVVDSFGKPVEDARVRIRASNFGPRTLYTPASGIVTLPGVPLPRYVTVDAAKENVTASGGGDLLNRTQPLKLTLNLGTYATAEGYVDAEIGGGVPSVGTRVVLRATSSLIQGTLQLETLTDAMGAYRFTGIPVKSTNLTVLFYGPDDTTIGATITEAVADGDSLIDLGRVRIDATPPRVLSIDPPVNATNVSPSASIYVTFSEQISATYLTNSYFKLIPTDGSPQVTMSFGASVRPDGTHIIKLTPPAASGGQKFPLKSNVLYRLTIVNTIQDTTGNKLKGDVGSSFTTVNYTEPAVVSVTPPENLPIPEGTTFRIKFNKAIDAASFDAGNGGMLRLERLDSYKGTVVETIPVSRQVDPADATTLVVAPSGVAIAESSFYRITISGTRDTQNPPNTQAGEKKLEFFSFDTKKPAVTINSPVGANESLVSGVLYMATATIVDETTGSPSSDIAYVDWMSASGTLLSRVKTKPFTYSFTAPSTSTPTTYTLRASATDLSGNTSTQAASFTWNVVPNVAPANIVVTNTPDSVYPSGRVTSRVRFTDEGLSVTVVLELRGTNAADGTPYSKIVSSQKITRASTAVAFADAVFTHDIPVTLKDGTATVVAVATDSTNKSASGEASLTLLADTTPPVFVSVLPKAETHYQFNQTYTIELQVKDAETGVARATFTVAGTEVLNATSGTYNSSTGVTTFKKTITVPPKNADTRIAIVVKAFDNKNNVTTDTREVIYDRVDDETLPKAAWLTPLDGAALPSNRAGWQTTLRVRATDNTKVTAVKFESTALASPITVTTPKSGTTDIFEAKATLTMPAEPFAITATVSDGDPAHDVELPITVDPIVATRVIDGDFNIASGSLSQYQNESVLVIGKKLYVTVPITLKNLMLVDGAQLSNPEEQRLDVTITDRLFVDADSRVDVTGKGYLGGLQKKEDNSFTNSSLLGRTFGGTTNGGANGADGSHGGIGGWLAGSTNVPYGSILDPIDFGAGGGGSGTNKGGNGGGAVSLRGGTGLSRIVLAGNVRADGARVWSAGAGGSVLLESRALITSPFTRITANGADDDASDQHDSGGGGGRVSVRVSERFDYDASAPLLQARGGRNDTGTENASYVDGGAGTVFLKKPDDALGTLRVSAFDERFPSTTHRAGGTPLGGDLTFDAITVGPRALARLDAETSTTMTVDPTARVVQPDEVPAVTIVSTIPSAGGSVAQNTVITRSVTASSAVGIRSIRTILSVQPADVLTFPKWPTTYSDSSGTIAVPSNATVGTATLKVRVTDRSGRYVDSAPVTFSVISNAAPVIQTFNVTPAETYANRNVSVSATATDDIAVKTLTLTASSPATVSSSAAPNPATPMSRTFTVNIPATTQSGSDITLTLSAVDDFPGRIPTTATKSVKVLADTIAPSATVVTPQPNQELQESTGATFNVDVNATDAEVAVKRVSVTFEGVESDLALVSGSLYRKTLSVPSVTGSEPVPKTLTVKAFDYDNNVTTRDVLIYIKPLLDPTAPAMSWNCASPSAMYPPGVEFAFRVNAVPYTDPVTQLKNGVTAVTVKVGNGTPINATRIGTSDVFEAKYTIPAGTADGYVLPVTVVATSQSGADATLNGEVTAIIGLEIGSVSTIEANDTAFEDTSFVVRSGGTLTIVGAHKLKKIALVGGKLVQRAATGEPQGALAVDRLYVACGSSVDAYALGYPKSGVYPGIRGACELCGGGHIGGGGVWLGSAGGSFGSVYRPMELGGGGHVYDKNYNGGQGGGVIRLHANESVIVDGTITANGFDNTADGAGAGGSIWITTPGVVSGAGTITARGGGDSNTRGTGGGGAIAIEYGTLRGNIVNNLVARGGKGATGSKPGAAGTVYLKGPQSVYGDLTIDNSGVSSASTSESQLPFFGHGTVTDVAADGAATIEGPRWIPAFVTGNWVRVIAPDGAVRGTWRVAGVENPSSTRSAGIVDFFTTDSAAYSGYIFWSDTGYPVAEGYTRNLFAARYNNGTFEWDNNNGGFVPFAPRQGDFIVGTFTKTAQGITRFERVLCSPSCPTVLGLPTLEVVLGGIVPNVFGGETSGAPDYNNVGGWNPSEFQAAGDGHGRGVVLSDGSAPKITLEEGAIVQPGDTIRGVYLFDSLKATNSKVYTADLLDVTTAPVLQSGATIVTGNAGAPQIDASRITISRNKHGAVLTGAAGAITDPEQPVNLAARNIRLASPPHIPAFSSTNRISVEDGVSGFAMRKIPDELGAGSATTATPITGYGYVHFRSGRSDKGFSVKTQTGNHGFSLAIGGTYNVLANNAAVSGKNGSYTTATRFRIEVVPGAVRWYVDAQKVHEISASIASTQVLFTLNDDAGAIVEIVYDPTWLSARASAASDGSFSMQMFGAEGDAIVLSATDRGRVAFTTSDVAVETFPADVGAAAVTFAQPEVVGGRTIAATVTLRGPAPDDGALVQLSSGSTALATVPASVTVAAGATSATFNVTTFAVSTASPVEIHASWGGVSATGALTVVKDNVAPAITIVTPVANAEIGEGSPNTIAVHADVVEEDAGLARVFVTLDGVETNLTKNTSKGPNAWTANVPSPYVSGTANVPKQLTITAIDNSTNSGTAGVTIQIMPVLDDRPPAISFVCMTPNVIFPAGQTTTLRVKAVAPAAPPDNPLHTITFTVTDPDGVATTYNATSIGNDQFEMTFPVPNVADGKVFTIRATATTTSGSNASADSSFTVVAGATMISGSASRSASSPTETLVVTSGATLTLSGELTFDRVIVLSGGKIVHNAPPSSTSTTAAHRVHLNANSVYVACGGLIDASARGYAPAVSYPGVPVSASGGGGSHIGRSGVNDAATYGSVYHPLEHGAGAFSTERGGGVIRVAAKTMVVDGTVRANGASYTAGTSGRSGGAGGSIWITIDRIGGAGSLEVEGGDGCTATGGGGALSIEYTDPASTLPARSARTGARNCSSGTYGGPGSIYVRGPHSTFGDLTFDVLDRPSGFVHLQGMRNGIALSGSNGSTLVTDSSSDIPKYFEGHWVRISTAGGTIKGYWQVASVSGKTVTLTAKSGETMNVVPGDLWRGMDMADTLEMKGMDLASWDWIYATDWVIKGTVTLHGIGAKNVHVTAGSTLQHFPTFSLWIGADNEVRVDAGAVIDASGRGYAFGTTYPGAAPASSGDGGSHMGRGGNVGEGNKTYGSVYRPQEAGAGDFSTLSGGGVVRIETKALIVDGAIRADGVDYNGSTTSRGGSAGGSIWIRATRISGNGSIEADGGRGCGGSGGGGALAIEYTDNTSTLPVLFARGGTKQCSSALTGAPGTIYVKGPNSTYGDLTIDSDVGGTGVTELQGLGSGTAQSGSSGATLVTGRSEDIPAYFEGHWVRITSATGTVKGTWRVAPISAATPRTITLNANSSSGSPNIQVGDRWQGIYLFDKLVVRNTDFGFEDPIEATEKIIEGTVTESAVATVKTTNLTLAANAVLQPWPTETLTINVSNELRIEASARIDASSRGYALNTTYPGASPINSGDGGSHIGRGGSVNETNATYGSVYQPRENGAGDEVAMSGGGVLRINAGTLVVNGSIRANGGSTTSSTNSRGGGGGGSIWITANRITGTGTIEADGGTGCGGGGGGGAIAVEYTDATSTLPPMFARGGTKNCGSGFTGAPGTVYVKGPAATYGAATIDAASRGTGLTDLPSLGNGLAATGSGGATLVTDRATNVPTYFDNHWVEIARADGMLKGRWQITVTTNSKTVNLLTNSVSGAPNVAAGDRWRGVYRFDKVTLRNANVLSGDGVESATYDLAGSPLNHNTGWPRWTSAPRADGTNIIGDAGSITDNELPIRVVAKNDRTGALSSTITVAANGAFTIPVTGADGDTFTVTATDGQATYPLSSNIAAAGFYGDLPKLAFFVIEPESITAGDTATGTVHLTKPAGASGEVVTLSSSNPAVLAVPASVTVAPNMTTATFKVTTGTPTQATKVFVTATLRTSGTVDYDVVPAVAAISSLTLDPPVVEGGTSVTATVTLSAPAPSTNAWVQLFTTNPDLADVRSLTIPAGSTSGTYTITTSRVAAPSNVTITALFGATKTADLQLTACSAWPSPSPITTGLAPWFDDAPPANATATGDATFDTTQAGSGTKSLHFAPASGIRTWSFTGATPMSITAGSELAFHLLVNPCNPPRQVLVTWSDGTNSWTASWGESRIDVNSPQIRMGALPRDAQWTLLEASADALGITANTSINKLTISVDGGEAWVDYAGSYPCWAYTEDLSEEAWNETTWFASGVPSGNTTGCPSVSGNATQQCITSAPAFHVNEGDVLYAYVEIDACDPPEDVTLQWYDGTAWKSRSFAGSLPQRGQRMRFEVPASALGLEGASLSGFAFTVAGGTAIASDIGKYDRANIAAVATKTETPSALDVDLGAVLPIDDVVVPNAGSLSISEVPFASSTHVSRYELSAATTVDISRFGRYLRFEPNGGALEVWAKAGTWLMNYASGAAKTDAMTLDLTAVRAISTIEILGTSAQNFYLLTSDAPFTSTDLATTLQQPNVRAYYFANAPSAQIPIHRTARYIRVQKSDGSSVALSDIRVWSREEQHDALAAPRVSQ